MRGAWSFEIAGTWDGRPAPAGEHARVELRLDERIALRVDAPFHGDPAPAAPPGPVDGLWEHEVVELFLLGRGEEYLEIELGPGGHHLGLRLSGRRRIVAAALPLEFAARVEGGRWRGRASLERRWLPPGLRAANACAIHGAGAERRYLAAHPLPGEGPDFHRLEAFPPLERFAAPSAPAR